MLRKVINYCTRYSSVRDIVDKSGRWVNKTEVTVTYVTMYIRTGDNGVGRVRVWGMESKSGL